jgi:UTP--glucose-1-phosphate uridylyltransferase
VQLAADREDLGPELRPWLKDFAQGLRDEPREILEEMPTDTADASGGVNR